MARDLEQKIDQIHDQIEDISDTVYKIDKEVALHKAAFDDHLVQDEKMYEEFRRMNDILQQNTDSLKEHMRRTETAEKQLILLSDIVAKIDMRLAPIEKSRIENDAVAKYRAINNGKLIRWTKIIGAITAIIGAIIALKHI